KDDYAIYMLDMGKPVPILEVAETMIRMAGKSPYTDIPIRFTGTAANSLQHSRFLRSSRFSSRTEEGFPRRAIASSAARSPAG
ncbi:polysaccharide biosynthesis protein, partial [Mesorhizobium sp. M4B.F.Ca.ET.017.02.2.1]|uniref:polysaccharide biosynthesis protein n=1 Tax=Mesorhizobium sp. M4B.F.Ca.ET.017.02.2.1 TaxID=2496649 RepID=UPI000FD339C2